MNKLSLFLALLLVASSVQADLSARSITFAWDPNPERNVAGYVFYQRIGRQHIALDFIEQSKKPSYTIDRLKKGTYFFSVTAYNKAGVESDYSDEIALRVPPK